jgi:tetratricopeptide (TPR) repeat protein
MNPRIAVLLAVTLFCSSAAAEEQSVGPLEVPVTIMTSASEQLSDAAMLASKIPEARTQEEKRSAALRAIVSYQVIPRKWPNESGVVVAAGLAEADLWLDLRAAKNAVTVLERLVPVMKHHPNFSPLYRRLGKAYEMLTMHAEADYAFERAGRDARLNQEPVLAVAVLRESARYYERTGRLKEASSCYRRLSHLASVDATSRALAAVDAAAAELRAGDRQTARIDVEHARSLVRAAAAKRSDRAVQMLEDEVRRLEQSLSR